jgi:hypothetical protein
MTEPLENGYDATRDPRTGRPILPLDAEKARKAQVESEPLTDEDNLGIDIGNENEPEIQAENPDEISKIEEDEEKPRSLQAEDEGTEAPSAEEINRITPRRKSPDIESGDSEEDLIDRNI